MTSNVKGFFPVSNHILHYPYQLFASMPRYIAFPKLQILHKYLVIKILRGKHIYSKGGVVCTIKLGVRAGIKNCATDTILEPVSATTSQQVLYKENFDSNNHRLHEKKNYLNKNVFRSRRNSQKISGT